MTVPCLSQAEFFDHLRRFEWRIVSSEFWETHDRVIFGKDDITIPVQLLARYYYPIVYRTCKLFEIPCPPDHLHSYYQHYKANDPCHCGSGTIFKECHGKTE